MKTNQRTNLQTTIVNFIRGQQLFLVVIEGLSRLNHKFSLLFFKDEVRENASKDRRNFLCRHYPGHFLLPIGLLSFGNADCSSEVIDQPTHKTLISITDSDVGRKIDSCPIDLACSADATGFLFHDAFVAHRDSPFPIQKTSQVNESFFVVLHMRTGCHNNLLSVHRDRLNPETSLLEDAIVRTQAIYKTCEGFPKSVPARGTGSKVTVRTAATVPLTDGQTPAGDQLSVTDFQAQIQWYGSFVTITDQVQYVVQDRVNVLNALYKSSLIDLELLAA